MHMIKKSLLFYEIALLVEILDAFHYLRVMAYFEERAETVEDVNLSLEENDSIEMLEDVCGDDDWESGVCLSKHCFELFFEVIGVRSETAVKEALSFEGFFLCNSFFLLEFDLCQFQRMIVGTLPEEKHLLVLESLYAILQVIHNLITCNPALQVIFPIPIAHYLVKFLQLKPPAGQNGFHCLVDVRCECQRIQLCQHFWFELSQVSQIVREGAGDETADSVGGAIFISEFFHLVGVLVKGHQLVYVHLDENGLYTTAVALKRHLCLSDRHPNAADIVNQWISA